MTATKPNDEIRKLRAAAGAKGGKTVTPKKRAHLASIASKGGKTVTEKRREHLAGIASSGGKTVTEKKRAHLRKALAARWAKAKAKSTAN